MARRLFRHVTSVAQRIRTHNEGLARGTLTGGHTEVVTTNHANASRSIIIKGWEIDCGDTCLGERFWQINQVFEVVEFLHSLQSGCEVVLRHAAATFETGAECQDEFELLVYALDGRLIEVVRLICGNTKYIEPSQSTRVTKPL